MHFEPFIRNPEAYSTSLEKSLELIKEAVQDEKNDELFYDYLIRIAPTVKERQIIESIRDDERKHNKMFKKIYKDFTGMDISAIEDECFQKPKSYLEGIEKALFGELAAVEKYRDIREGLSRREYRDMVFEILTDELKHGNKYNYILSKNKPQINSGNMGNNVDYTPDQWVMYIDPLVKRALEEYKEKINLQHLFQEFILSGVLVGLGKTPKEAIEQVEKWEKTGESKLLKKSKKKR